MDKKNIQELLKGLSADKVGIENIDKYLQQQGVIVDIHIGRIRGSVKATPKTFGVDISKSTDLKDFFNDYVNSGNINFIPDNPFEKKLRSIEVSIRTEKAKKAIGYDNKFMPIDIYKEYAEYVEKKKIDYFKMRDEIIDNWDYLIEKFKNSFKKSVEFMNPKDSNELMSQVFSQIPKKEKYKESFYINTSLKAFPAVANLPVLDESIDEKIKEGIINDNMNTIYNILSNSLQDAFDVVNSILVDYQQNSRILPKKFTDVQKLIPRLKSKNLLKNDLIDNIIESLKKIDMSWDDDDVIEQCENIMALIYSYAKDIGVLDKISFNSSMLSNQKLEEMYKCVS